MTLVPDPNKYDLTIDDVCRLAGGVHRTTLWRWIKDGDFPEPAKVGKRKRWSVQQLILANVFVGERKA